MIEWVVPGANRHTFSGIFNHQFEYQTSLLLSIAVGSRDSLESL